MQITKHNYNVGQRNLLVAKGEYKLGECTVLIEAGAGLTRAGMRLRASDPRQRNIVAGPTMTWMSFSRTGVLRKMMLHIINDQPEEAVAVTIPLWVKKMPPNA